MIINLWDHLILTRRPDLMKIKKKYGNLPYSGFCHSSRPQSVKINDSKKRDKYLDFARELRKLRNIRVMVIPIVIGPFQTVPKGWEGLARKVGKQRKN